MKLERTHVVTDTEDIIWILRELERTIEDLKDENESLTLQSSVDQDKIDELYGEVADLEFDVNSLEETLQELRDKLKEKESLIQELQVRLAGLEK